MNSICEVDQSGLYVRPIWRQAEKQTLLSLDQAQQHRMDMQAATKRASTSGRCGAWDWERILYHGLKPNPGHHGQLWGRVYRMHRP
eukprot:6179501-Pleurochrysis_carterae.AAC.2